MKRTNSVRQAKIEHDSLLEKAIEKKEIIQQSSEGNFGMYDVIPSNTGRIVGDACDRFFESRNIKYGSSWFHGQKDRKKELQKLKDEQNKDH